MDSRFADVTDGGKVLLVNLAKGKIGETNAALLGALLLADLQVAARSRAETAEVERRDFIVFLDGTLIAFRVGRTDAEFLAKEFFPTLSPLEKVNLPNWGIYLRLMIEGRVSQGFSGKVGTNGSGG